MDESAQGTVDSLNKLLLTLNALAPQVQLFVAVIGLAFATYFGIRLYLVWKAKKLVEQGKQDRANKMNESMNRLSKTMDEHTKDSIKILSDVVESHKKLVDTNEMTQALLRDMLAKQVGVINKEDCTRLIETYFQNVLLDEVARIFTYSLTKNDYSSRPEFVQKRVKTAISDVLKDTRTALGQYKLSVDPEIYFPVIAGDKERFSLCDNLWGRIEHLYLDHAGLSQRIEEANLLIKNVIDDHLVTKRHEVSNFYKD